MYMLKITCQDNGKFYFDTGAGSYPAIDKALLAAYSAALNECRELNEGCGYFEV